MLVNNAGILPEATTPDEGAAIVTQMALIRADGPTGGFFEQAGPVGW
jgi:hypothetical protein